MAEDLENGQEGINSSNDRESLSKRLLRQAGMAGATLELVSALNPQQAQAAEQMKPEALERQTAPIGQEAYDRQRTAEDVAAAVRNRGADLIAFSDIKETEINRKYFLEAKAFIENNMHLRGEKRHLALEAYLEESFRQIKELRQNETSTEEITQLELITQATYHEFNSLVKAGEPEDIIRAGLRAGMVSREHSREVMRALFRSNQGVRIDIDKMQVTIDNETLQISESAIFAQIIGNEAVETPMGMNEGTVLEGTYDVEKTDPAEFAKLQKDRRLVTELVEMAWPEIFDKLKSQGVNADSQGEQFKEAYIEAIMTGNEQTVTFETGDGRKVGLAEQDTKYLEIVSSIQSESKEYLGTDQFPEIQIIPAAEPEMEKAVARVSADLKVIGGRISHEQLCKGNFSMLISVGDFQLFVDREIVEKIFQGDHMIIFDRLLAVPPMPARDGVTVEKNRGQGFAPGTGRKDADRGREVLKEKPRFKGGAQATTGLHPNTYATSEHAFSIGRLSEQKPKGQRGNKGTHARPKAGRRNSHTGKQLGN
jgi:hypothetical protein